MKTLYVCDNVKYTCMACDRIHHYMSGDWYIRMNEKL